MKTTLLKTIRSFTGLVLILLLLCGCAVEAPPAETGEAPQDAQTQITFQTGQEQEIPQPEEETELSPTEELPDGLVSGEDGLFYYLEGEKQTFSPGIQEIGGLHYYVLSDGVTLCGMQDTLTQMDDGTRCYFEADSSLREFQAGFATLPDGVYYAPSDGFVLADYSNELVVIDGKGYAFDEDGRLMIWDTGVQTIFGKTYLLDEPGSVIPMWEPGPLCREDALYYVGEDGTLLTDEAVGRLRFEADGRYTSGSAELDECVDAFLSDALTEWSSDTEEMLKTAYHYFRDNFRYLSMAHYQAGTTDWETDCALTFFRQGKGNCYCWAAALSYAARRLGYQAYEVAGWEYSPTNDHAWTMIDWPDGETYLFDAELEYAYWYMFSNKPKIDMFRISGDGKYYNGFRYYFPG